MTCEIRSGVCWTVATTQVYRWGWKFWACEKCAEAIKSGVPLAPLMVQADLEQRPVPTAPSKRGKAQATSTGIQGAKAHR